LACFTGDVGEAEDKSYGEGGEEDNKLARPCGEDEGCSRIEAIPPNEQAEEANDTRYAPRLASVQLLLQMAMGSWRGLSSVFFQTTMSSEILGFVRCIIQ
jgi:hypothetical protein